MHWEKKGRIYTPDGTRDWQKQFAMLPTPLLMDAKRLRIYLGFCDAEMIGRIGYVDVDPENPARVLHVSERPVLDIGAPGSFDDHGVVPVSVLREEGKIYLYYVGFQLREDVPYTMFAGLAVSDDGEQFTRVSTASILPPTSDEPYARCGVHVMRDGKGYRMLYIGSIGEGWTEGPTGKRLPLYSMKSLASATRDAWNSAPETAMQFQNTDEHGFGRPYAWKENDLWRMLYSIRTYSQGYLIGYAESADGVQWVRKDEEAGLSPSGNDWESESVSYPHLFTHHGKTYVFYNGNGCGKTGVGYAERV